MKVLLTFKHSVFVLRFIDESVGNQNTISVTQTLDGNVHSYPICNLLSQLLLVCDF